MEVVAQVETVARPTVVVEKIEANSAEVRNSTLRFQLVIFVLDLLMFCLVLPSSRLVLGKNRMILIE